MQLILSEAERESAKVRRPIYKDVEQLIAPGFLSHQASIQGITFSFRSLTQQAIFLLNHRVGLEVRERIWKEWAMAMGTWMVDGQLILGDPQAAWQVRKILQFMPPRALDDLFSIFVGFFSRVGRALGLMEAFCYEDFARSLWRFSGKGMPNQVAFTGVLGSENIGLNSAQQVWMAYNQGEDEREEWEQEWELAKFIASASAPKAIKQMAARDKNRTAVERDRRLQSIHQAYWEATGGQGDLMGGGIHVQQAITREDLIEEMQRVRSGEKDMHDMIVEDYKDRIRHQHSKAEQEHKQRMLDLQTAAAEELAGTDDGVEATALVGYTRDQIAAFRKGPKHTRVQTSTPVNALYEKYIEPPTQAGAWQMGDGKAAPVQTGRLEEALEERKPLFHRGEPKEDAS